MAEDASITIYHNPRCSKSRSALALIQENAGEPQIIEYLKQPLSAAELSALLKRLGKSPRDLLRKGESVYKDLGLSNMNLSDEVLIDAMAKHPILMERPVVFSAKGAVIGRPPEAVLDIL